MAGVTNIQVQAALHFDDGYALTISTPLWKKDIRTGDYFSDDLTQQILQEAGQALASIVEHHKLSGLRGVIQAQIEAKQDRRKPKPSDPFSIN